MTRDTYQRTSRKMQWIITAWSLVFIVPVVLLIHTFGTSLQSSGSFLRSHVGEVLGGLIGGLLFGVPPLLTWFAVAWWLDRQYGIRCPHCHRSLARSIPSRVLDTGECS